MAVCTNHRRIEDAKYIKENKRGHWYDQIRRDTEVQQQKVVISVDAQHSATYYIRSNERTALATCMGVRIYIVNICQDGHLNWFIGAW